MGTSCLCSSSLFCRFPVVNYPYCSVSHSHSCLQNGATRLPSIISDRTKCRSVMQAQKSLTADIQPEPKYYSSPYIARFLARPILAVAVAVILGVNSAAVAAEIGPQQEINGETLSNVPQMLSGNCVDGQKDCKKPRIQRPKSRQAETCTVKCVNTCIRGGGGSPGEGPLNVRRPLVVFKQGFRSRQYCLVECSDICNLIRDGEDGP